MQQIYKQYLVLFIVVELLLALLSFFMVDKISIPIFVAPLFCALLGLLIAKVFENPKFEKIAKFSSMFMLVNTLKLIVCVIALLVVYVCLDLHKRLAFAIVAMCIYLVFTFFDSKILLEIFKRKDDNSQKK